MPQMGNPAGDIEKKKTGKTPSLPPDSQHQAGDKMLEQAQFPPARHGLGPAVDVEFAIDVSQVLFDRAWGDYQPAGDLLVREAFGEQSQHLPLALGEWVDQRFSERGRQGNCLRHLAPLRLSLLAEGIQELTHIVSWDRRDGRNTGPWRRVSRGRPLQQLAQRPSQVQEDALVPLRPGQGEGLR